MTRAWLPLVSGVLIGGSALSAQEPVRYRLLPESRLEVETGKSGLFGFAGHTHRIRARSFSGEIGLVTPDTARSTVHISLATDSLEVLTPPDTQEIRKVTESMREEVLETGTFPEISFASTAVRPEGKGLEVTGNFTMHGTTRVVTVELALRGAGDTLRATGRFELKQTDFGIKPFRGGPAGTVKVADKVKFVVDVLALREP